MAEDKGIVLVTKVKQIRAESLNQEIGLSKIATDIYIFFKLRETKTGKPEKRKPASAEPTEEVEKEGVGTTSTRRGLTISKAP